MVALSCFTGRRMICITELNRLIRMRFPGITEVRLVIQDGKHLSYTAQDYDMPLPLCDFGGIVFAAITPAIRSFRC
jgi:hypothetical protein